MTGAVVLLALLAATVGAAVGSYWGVVADRGWAGSISGRSRCDGCGRQLTWLDLVPVASYLALRGRCRGCHAAIPAALLGRELVGAAVGGAVGLGLALVLRR